MKYTTRGVCSRSIEFDVVDNKVTGVKFEGAVLVIPRVLPHLLRAWTLTKLSNVWKELNAALSQHPVLTSLQLHSSNILPISNLWEILNASNEYI